MIGFNSFNGYQTEKAFPFFIVSFSSCYLIFSFNRCNFLLSESSLSDIHSSCLSQRLIVRAYYTTVHTNCLKTQYYRPINDTKYQRKMHFFFLILVLLLNMAIVRISGIVQFFLYEGTPPSILTILSSVTPI